MSLALTLGPDPATWPADGTGALRGVVAFAVVFGLLGLLVWLLRRGTLGLGPLGARRRHAAIVVETAVPLGERRSLMVVSVEGRRLLIGLTPMQVSLVVELQATAASFSDTLERQLPPLPGGRS